MKDLDTDAIHRIILECSSDSAYTARQLRQDKKVDAAVAYDLRGGGAVGELVLAGLQDEPYATGDIFRRGDDGSLTFHARVDGMLVLGSGEMVDPAPLERAREGGRHRHPYSCARESSRSDGALSCACGGAPRPSWVSKRTARHMKDTSGNV